MTHDDSQTRQEAAQFAETARRSGSGTATRRTFLKTTAVGAAGVAAGSASVASAQSDDQANYAVSLDLSNLPEIVSTPLDYRVWAYFDDEAVHMGNFEKGDEYVFQIDRDLREADRIEVVMEGSVHDEEPNDIVYLEGTFEDGEADLSFPIDFSDAGGSYLLNTPTDPDAPAESGIWFLEPDPEGEGHVASLDLPDLSDVGWRYHAWIEMNGEMFDIGEFDHPAQSDDEAEFSGDEDAPPFPGEDFVRNAPNVFEFPTDLRDGSTRVAVTLETDGHPVVVPSQFKALEGTIPEDAETATPIDLPRNEGTFPSGTATQYRNVDAARGQTDQKNAVSFDFSGLPEIGEEIRYEAWAVYGEEEHVLLGEFAEGQEYVFGVDRDIASAEEIQVTLHETDPDTPRQGGPNETVLLSGDLDGEEIDLSFPADLEDAFGSYLLNTPTDPDAPPESGVWFLQPDGEGGHEQSLHLPDVTPGWTYEGWVVHDGQPLTTGKFEGTIGADRDSPYSGPTGPTSEGENPGFPGEDFVRDAPDGLEFPLDLTTGDSTVAITVEPAIRFNDPYPDEPFPIEVLTGAVPEDAEPGTNYDLELVEDASPSGTATLYDDVEAAQGSDGMEYNAVAFDFSMLPDLGDGAYYEVWAVSDAAAVPEKVSTGVFSKGQEYVFGVDRDLSRFSEIVITIEPDDEAGGDPSGIVALSGSLSDGEADLSFPVDFSEASGSYLLNTPTTPADAPTSEGIWFLQPDGDGGHEASLDVPELPDGWVYEGWGVTQGTPLTTGRFDDPTMADDAAPYSGGGTAPAFPGEDFYEDLPEGVEPAVDLADGDSEAVISVEPDLDGEDPTGPAPFQIKPLVAEIPEDADLATSYDFDRNTGTTPSGTATLYDDVDAATGSDEDGQNALALDLSMLPDLGDDAYYEGWAIYDGGEEKVSTGVFSKGEEYAFEIDRDLSSAEKIAITIEADDEAGGEPSGVVVLSGSLSDGEADLSFPVDLDSDTGAGSYRLATPTAPDAPDTGGVWFLGEVVGTDSKIATLNLPAISADGWTYEGWVVHDGTPLTTGRFDDPEAADRAAPYSGDEDAPPFPGEDFVQGLPDDVDEPVDLADGASAVVVSVEPDVDDEDPTGPAPFDIKPRVGEIPANASAGTNYQLQVNDGAAPEGVATLHDDLEAARDGSSDPVSELRLALSNLPELGAAVHYEAWVRFENGDTVSAGILEPDGPADFELDRDLSTATWVGITIEPDAVPGGDPDTTLLLDGELSEDGIAELSFPQSLEEVSGSYLLNTPTAPNAPPESGVWFLQPDGDGHHEQSLDLQSTFLPDGWTYEGWIVHEGEALSTGRFHDPVVSDDSSTYSGDAEAAPAFPGEDLVANAPDGLSFPTDLTDGESKVVVTIEPEVDGRDPTGDAPFQLKPLVGDVPADAEAGTNYELQRNLASFPSGTAVVGGEGTAAVIGDGHLVRDLDGDGNYRDVNGDGTVSMMDVNDFFQNQHTPTWDERVDLFDFDGNDDVGQSDVIALFEYVA